jgi:hypothetical protein
MKSLVLLLSLIPAFAGAEEWIFEGLVRLNVPSADAGIARVFNIPTERFYQSKITFKTESKSNDTIHIVFTGAEIRYLINGVPSKPDFDLPDNIVSRRIVIAKTIDGFRFYDDPNHILNETLPFDMNMLCLMLDLNWLPYAEMNAEKKEEEPVGLIWSMSYVNQEKYKILERLMANLSHEWGDNQVFTVNINRDEIYRDKKTVITGTSDGLGEGVISHTKDGTVSAVNLTVHLDRSLLVQEPGQEGRLRISEEQDFVLEHKP